jgi:Ecdysteroid kinase-like family
VRLPLTKEEITATWLSEALAPRWPGVAVKAIHHESTLLGSATKIRLLVDYGPSSGHADLPQTLWIKLGLEPFQRELESALGVYAIESVAYGKILPRYDVNRPDCYFAASQKEPAQGVFLLEDLMSRNAVFGSALRPLSIAQVAAGLETLASLHAQSWEDVHFATTEGILPVLTTPLSDLLGQWVANATELFGVARGYAIPVALHDAARLKAAWDSYRELMHQGPQCFLHGDTHIGNVYLEPDGNVGFLDWQIACTGLWVHDFAYFVITALDWPDRRRGERDLLDHYLKALRKYGASSVPDFADAWDLYRKSVVYGLVSWLGCTDDLQPAEINTASLARHGAAMVDLGTYEALGIS